MTKTLVFFWFLFVSREEVWSLSLTSLPSVLFSGGSLNILDGSVVWLYCIADPISPNLTITWTKDSEPLVQDVPHIRLKSTGTHSDMYSTLILVVDKFQASDSGEYQCVAQDEGIISLGNTTRLIATASGRVTGQLELITSDLFATLPFPYTSRIGYAIGRVIFHQFVFGHVGDSSNAYQIPSVLWLKDGMPLRIAPINTPGTNGRLTTSLLLTFATSDAGVYQVVFTDTTRSEVFITDPIRLDTGETLSIKAVSPPITILRPPEKLVLEVTATGRYDTIQWTRNDDVFQSTGFDTGPENFANFLEIYFNEPTTEDDIGVYEVVSLPTGGSGQIIPERILFFVIQSVAVLTVSGEADAPVHEGDNITISCTSTGIPIPIITWEFDNQSIPHLQSHVYTDYTINYNGAEVIPGSVVSTLHIVNAQYPADAGEYVCTGSNSYKGVTTNSSAMITVRFLGLFPLVVTSLPELLFNGMTQTLVEGSVVWLYCEVDSTASSLTVTWNKDGNSLVQDVPHIIIRRTSPSMFLLIVNDLQAPDSGEYQCSVFDEYSEDSGTGMVLTLAVSAVTTDTLQALSNEVDVDPLTQTYFANRAAYSSGYTANISCNAGYLSQSSFITTPEVTWLKDGIPVIHPPTNTQDSSDRLTTTLSFTFTESDAGVYQCIFTDTTRSELVADDPIQIDSGTLSIERVSPSTIIYRPPDKVVVEVEAAGEYNLLEWNVDGNRIQLRSDIIFSHFTEIFFTEPTTMATAGIYEVLTQTLSGVGVPDPIQFAVVNFVDANISVSSEPGLITVTEEESVNISCTATGLPVPTITWTITNQQSPFAQTDTFTNYNVTIAGASATLEAIAIPGSMVSTLHIVNPQYPAHNGGYKCIGTNTNGASIVSTSATISVFIPVLPEVEVTTVRTVVAMGDDVTLTCNVIRGNPAAYTYAWVHVNTSTTLASTSHILSLSSIGMDELGTYRCEVTNLVGIGMGIIELGVDPLTSISQQLLVGIEGRSVFISCNSTGVPVPAITWTASNQPGTLGEETFQINREIAFSTLVIPNVQYSADNALYTCTGSNTHGTDSVSISLQVLVPPEIEVTTNGTTVGLLDYVTLTCVVNRAVPMPDNYTWIHVDTNTTLTEESNSSTYTFTPFKGKTGTYRCEVITEAGYGMGTITIELEDVLAAISFPDVLFSGGSQNILEGSVVWLYCVTVPKSPTVTVTWSKDGEPLVQDVPHIRLRSTGSDADMYSTFLLVIEPVDITDGGMYQCSAQEGENIAMGPALTITVDDGAGNGTTEIIRSDNITDNSYFESHQSGNIINLYYIIGHVGDDNTSYQIPSVLWLKDGLPFRIAPTNTPDPRANGRLTTELIFTFTESDGGVYQLVSTAADSNGRLTMFLAPPIRLNTGETLDVQAVSPTNIILRPTEKLVLEVRASGRYGSIEWGKNGISFFDGMPDNESLAHFVEVYYNEFIGLSDFGVYNVTLRSVDLTQVPPVGVQFTVIQYREANTSVVGTNAVYIDEGQSVSISCTSTGAPVPTITWTFNNQTTPYAQTDVYTDINVTITGASTVEITQGNVVSTLRIVNLQYPSNTGDYVCSGSSNKANTTSSSAIIMVATAPLDVEVTADYTRVVLGDNVALICTVSSDIPLNYTYLWTYISTSDLTAEISRSHIVSLSRISMDQLGTYRCEVGSEIGTGMNAISIGLGDAPEVTARVNPPGPVVKGSIGSLVCDVIAGDLPISYSWVSSRGEGLSSDSESGSITVPFCAYEDYGIYTCTATNPFGSHASIVEVIPAVFPAEFVLCLSGVVPDCIEWIGVNSDVKINDLEQEILNTMNRSCQCNVERYQITATQFACSSQSSDSVSFFSTINGTTQVPTSELLGYLESWVASGVVVKAGQSQLYAALDCDSTAHTTETPISVGRHSAGIPVIILYITVAAQFSVIMILVIVLTATILVKKIRVQE